MFTENIKWKCHASVCSSVLCLVTTKIWSDGHLSPQRITALGSWTNCATALRQISVTAPFYLEDSRRIQDSKRREWRSAWGLGGEGERERERGRESTRTRTRERVREKALWLLLLYVFPPPGPALYKLGLARSAVCSVCSA